MKFNEVHTFVIEKLKIELPESISYHNFEHTVNVVSWAIYLSEKEGISPKETLLLKTAALFHETGYLATPIAEGHESRSVAFAQQTLPSFGYSNEEIEEISQIILATQLPQNPKNKLQELICDADLFYLGTYRYFDFAEKMLIEFRNLDQTISNQQWKETQVAFLKKHHYFSKTAKEELTLTKNKNLETIENQLIMSKDNKKRIHIKDAIQEYLIIAFGALLAGIALKLFLVPNHFFDGGITGLSLLVHELYHLNLGIVIVLLNLPLIAVGYFTVGKKFAYRTLIAVVLLGLILTILPEIPVTTDKLLISLFGGVFLGIGVGLNMRTGAALDGIEVLALYTLKRTSFTITEIILGINIIIFSIAAFKFGIETALYSCLTYFAASRTIDYVVEGLQAFTGVTIISSKSEDIKFHLVNDMKKGITVYKGERGYLPGSFNDSSECDIIFTLITRFELRKLKTLVYEIDPKAFVFASTIKEASGGILSRKQHH